MLINQQLIALGLPPVIIQNKSKQASYYLVFDSYINTGRFVDFTELLASLLIGALYKRNTLLSGSKIITVSAWAKANNVAGNVALNKAIRGTIPAFRMREKWMFDSEYRDKEL